jgi:signal transduction histidine kinase
VSEQRGPGSAGRRAASQVVEPAPSSGEAAAGSTLPTLPSREAQLAGLVTLAERLATLTAPEAVLDAVADAVMDTLVPDACAIELINEGGSDLSVSLTRGLEERCARWWAEVGSQAALPTDPPAPSSPPWPGDLIAVAPPSLLRLPLTSPDQRVVGALALFAARPALERITTSPTLRSIMIQASAALTAARARLREVLAVYAIGQSIAGRIDLAHLATSVLRAVADLFAASDGLIVLTEARSAGSGNRQVAAHQGVPLDHETIDALLVCCAERRTPFILHQLAPPTLAAGGRDGIGLVAPLWLERKLLGLLTLTYPVARAFRQSDLWLLSAIAGQVTMALRNAQLYLWSEELAITEERGRIAREIHDGLAQSLAHKVMKLDFCQRLIGRDEERLRQELTALKESVRADIQDVRRSILALRPVDLEQRGLRDAVETYLAQFSHDTQIRVQATIDLLDELSPKAQTALFRLLQEALHNIRKHAQATTAIVTLTTAATGMTTLVVADDGRGFDVEATLRRHPGQTGVGLKGMIERAAAAGGTLRITSAPGQGTRLDIALPSR